MAGQNALLAGDVAAPPMPNRLAQQPDPNDFTGRYNTALNPAEEAQYLAWVQAQSAQSGRDMGRDAYDYDLRGAWRSGAGAAANGHFPDDFKKPNHPTFSDQSRYHGVDGYMGGTWGGGQGQPGTFAPGPTNLQMRSAPALQRYFQEREPTIQLLLPMS